MTNFIPIFPLGIVVYPGENLNLHIFEPRYIQLINECFVANKPFGIPAVIDNKMREYGCMVEITEMVNGQAGGETQGLLGSTGGDIKTKGIKVFRVLEVIKDIPEKQYSGAIVTYPSTNNKGNPELMHKVMNGVRELHQLLKISKDFKKEEDTITCFNVAHHIGLSLEEEYELLGLFDERQRQKYLKLHLAKVIPMLTGMELLKEKIKLNGHFKNLSGFDL